MCPCVRRQSTVRWKKITELEGLKALVVDDDFNTCDSVTKMMVKVGMRAEWTLSGKEAVLRARQSIEMSDAYHAYIIDWRLPDMNGIEVTRQIRSLNDDTPIIILTAYDWSDIEVEAKAAGVTAFCSKPMFMSDLRETLMNAIGQTQTDEAQELLPKKEHQLQGQAHPAGRGQRAEPRDRAGDPVRVRLPGRYGGKRCRGGGKGKHCRTGQL